MPALLGGESRKDKWVIVSVSVGPGQILQHKGEIISWSFYILTSFNLNTIHGLELVNCPQLCLELKYTRLLLNI